MDHGRRSGPALTPVRRARSPRLGRAAPSRPRPDPGPDLKLRNRFGGISLIPAAERGHVAYVQALLRETATDVDHVNDLGWAALLEAVILGDGEGVTPLAHAERRGLAEIAGLLRG